MQPEKNELLSIYIFILAGLAGVSYGSYDLFSRIKEGWVCYSKHGHIPVSPLECQTDLFLGLGVSVFALAVGLYKGWERLNDK